MPTLFIFKKTGASVLFFLLLISYIPINASVMPPLKSDFCAAESAAQDGLISAIVGDFWESRAWAERTPGSCSLSSDGTFDYFQFSSSLPDDLNGGTTHYYTNKHRQQTFLNTKGPATIGNWCHALGQFKACTSY